MQLRTPFSVRLLKHYAKFINTKLFYRRYIVVGEENITPVGTPTVIACNHQNCMLDPLALIYPLHRYAKFLTRASVFANPTIGRILRKIGLLPAYRVDFDGIDAVKNNAITWKTTETELLGGQAVVIFPEGKHMHQRTLGEFQSGYTKMAFETARAADFRTPIYILPAANHYSHYGHMQCDLQISFGEPLALEPFYQLYQEKPRTAQRQVNAIIRERIEAMMLNISDLENYDAINFLVETYSRKLAPEHGLNADNLTHRLKISQQINAALGNLNAQSPELASTLYADALSLKKQIDENGLRTWLFDAKPTISGTTAHALALICLLPLFIFALIPNILIYLAPNLITPKLKDKRFEATIYVGMSLVTIPLIYLIFFAAEYFALDNIVIALIHTALLPILGLFAWHYKISLVKLKGKIKYQKCKNLKKNAEIATLYERLAQSVSEAVKQLEIK